VEVIDSKDLEVISGCVIPDSGIRFNGPDFRSLTGPQVYVFMKAGMPLYIGMSGNGMSRCANRVHKQAEVARAECDSVLVYPCVDRKAADKLESLLIKNMQPKYNKGKKIVRIDGIDKQRIRLLNKVYKQMVA
jgi:hypothetical protein